VRFFYDLLSDIFEAGVNGVIRVISPALDPRLVIACPKGKNGDAEFRNVNIVEFIHFLESFHDRTVSTKKRDPHFVRFIFKRFFQIRAAFSKALLLGQVS